MGRSEREKKCILEEELCQNSVVVVVFVFGVCLCNRTFTSIDKASRSLVPLALTSHDSSSLPLREVKWGPIFFFFLFQSTRSVFLPFDGARAIHETAPFVKMHHRRGLSFICQTSFATLSLISPYLFLLTYHRNFQGSLSIGMHACGAVYQKRVLRVGSLCKFLHRESLNPKTLQHHPRVQANDDGEEEIFPLGRYLPHLFLVSRRRASSFF